MTIGHHIDVCKRLQVVEDDLDPKLTKNKENTREKAVKSTFVMVIDGREVDSSKVDIDMSKPAKLEKSTSKLNIGKPTKT